MSNRAPVRIVAGLAAVVLFVVVAFGLLVFFWGAVYVSQPPDPQMPDGDPCCGYPDTWGEIVHAAGWTLAVAAFTGLVLCAAMAFLVLAFTGRLPPLRRLAIVEAGCVVLAAALLAAIALPHRDEAHAAIDCDAYAFDRRAWAAGGAARAEEARALEHCEALEGRTAAQVRALLGRPIYAGPMVDGERWWGYRALDVTFRDGRVLFAAVP